MKTELTVIELLQFILDNMDDTQDYYDLWYARCIKDLATLTWEDPNLYWIKKQG